jgi:hypothetical protein
MKIRCFLRVEHLVSTLRQCEACVATHSTCLNNIYDNPSGIFVSIPELGMCNVVHLTSGQMGHSNT